MRYPPARATVRMRGATNYEHCIVDHSSAACPAFSVLRWNEACHSTGRVAVDGFTQPGGPAGPFYPIYRRVRSAWRGRLDSPRTPADSAEADSACGNSVRDHHDWCNGTDDN